MQLAYILHRKEVTCTADLGGKKNHTVITTRIATKHLWQLMKLRIDENCEKGFEN
jgi:hypothetical protein